jgi:hypothetical protein
MADKFRAAFAKSTAQPGPTGSAAAPEPVETTNDDKADSGSGTSAAQKSSS